MLDGVSVIAPQNFDMVAGDTTLLTVAVIDEAGAIVDLTNATAIWQMARTAQTPALLTKTTDANAGITITDPLGGILTVLLDPGDTEGLTGRWYHELEVIDVAGDISTVITGFVTIRPDLIRHDANAPPIPPPPLDSLETIARKAGDAALAAADLLLVPLDGSRTMTGLLILSGDPQDPHGAATRQYVDAHVPPGAPFLPLAGGIITGPVVMLNLPTSNAGLQPGTLWNNGGFLCVA
jgi:hypothetical protein